MSLLKNDFTLRDFFNRKGFDKKYYRALFGLCIIENPDIVLDIGTNQGNSCIALGLALNVLGNSLSNLFTFDVNHSLFHKTKQKYKQLFQTTKLNIDKINLVTNDFGIISSEKFLRIQTNFFIFYDIHDGEYGVSNSEKFINEWIPKINDGLVVVHDIVPCDKDWERPTEWGTPPSYSKVQLWTGQWFWGFGECENFINLLNEHKANLIAIPNTSLIYFRVRNGKPIDYVNKINF